MHADPMIFPACLLVFGHHSKTQSPTFGGLRKPYRLLRPSGNNVEKTCKVMWHALSRQTKNVTKIQIMSQANGHKTHRFKNHRDDWTRDDF